MEKDVRYSTIKKLIQTGDIKTLTEIFDKEIITKTKVRKDLGIHNQRFNKLLEHPNKFLLDDLFRFAELIDLDEKSVVDLAINQWQQQKKALKKKAAK
jgi:hypothetical protein